VPKINQAFTKFQGLKIIDLFEVTKQVFPKQQKAIVFQIVANQSAATFAFLGLFLGPQKGLFRISYFRETLIFKNNNSSFLRTNLFLNLAIWYPLLTAILPTLHKNEDTMKQIGLLPPHTLPASIQYELLFEPLPPLALVKEGDRGRPSFCRDALLKAFIYKALRHLKTLTDLAFELRNNPMICQAVGLDLYKNPPSLERFSEFLRDTPHAALQNIRIQLVKTLLEERLITGKHLVMDSCPILAKVRENNLKTSASKRFDKTRILKGDPDARLGVLADFSSSSKKQIRYFWGYRNHILVDAQEELPVWEITHPADINEIHQAIPLLQITEETFSLNIQIVSGDALYDSEKILRFIIEDLHAQAVIPRNLRTERPTYTLKGTDLYCQADLPMRRKGKMTIKKAGITYLQYCCPIHFGREKQRHLFCPANHPKFLSQKGCNILIRLTPSIREHIDYGSEAFKELHKQRTSVERVFSRLLSIAMQDPPGIGIQATRNYCTIAHITVLLVALAAKRSGHPDKARFVRSFVPTLLS
jgi:hypothetical protein